MTKVELKQRIRSLKEKQEEEFNIYIERNIERLKERLNDNM